MKALIKNYRFYSKLKSTILICTSLAFSINSLFGQCVNCNANYPGGTFSTTSTSLVTVNTCIYGGEYSNYSVTSGQTYTWTTCGDTDFDTQLTLRSGGCGGALLAYNDDACGLQSTINWVATFTGTVTLLVSRYNCANQASCMTVQWACLTCGAPPPPPADYLMPTTYIQNEYVGSCLVSTCGSATFADNGNVAGNYSNSVNNIYRVFCPNTAFNCMSVTFSSFNTESGFDWLNIGNGPTQNSPLFTTAPANAAGQIMGTPSVPFTYTSTSPSGCLTFRFRSDNVVNRPGWYATLQCVPCAGGPNGTDNNDCQNMTPLCSSAPITTNSTGPGIIAEGCSGSTCPAGGENHTNWYTFTAQTSGTLNVTVTPATGTDDYDFAIFGPNVTCGALGSPLRCSDSGNTGVTGAMPPGAGTTEDVLGDGYVSQLNVIAGESYILVVDKWSPTGGTGYTLSFGGTASLDCTVLPVELLEFTANYSPDLDIVDLFWSTASEHESDYFEVERSTDGTNYNRLVSVNAAGNTNYETQYYTIDENPNVGVNYYRLKQYDLNGEFKYSEVIAVNILDDVYDLLSCFPNPTTGLTEVTYNSYTQEEVQLSVTCYDGTVLVKTPLNADKGANRFNVDLSGFAKGLYFVTIFTNNKIYSSKLVKE